MDDLLKKGLSLLKQATELDGAGQTQQAIAQYLLGLDALVRVHGYEKLELNRALLKEKIALYMSRVETLKGLTAPSPPPPQSLAATGPVAGAAASPAARLDPAALPSPPSDVVLPQVPTSLPVARRDSVPPMLGSPRGPAPAERSVALAQGQTGVSYGSLFGPYLRGAVRVTLEDPFLSAPHQLRNLVAFVEAVCMVNDCYEILVVTRSGGEAQTAALEELRRSLKELGGGLVLSWRFSETLHDRALRLSNGWKIVLGRGLDFWLRPAGFSKFFIGAAEQTLRRTMECELHFLRENNNNV